MSNLFDFEEHPFKGRKVFISGYDSPMRKRLSAYISAAGGEKASVISKNVSPTVRTSPYINKKTLTDCFSAIKTLLICEQ